MNLEAPSRDGGRFLCLILQNCLFNVYRFFSADFLKQPSLIAVKHTYECWLYGIVTAYQRLENHSPGTSFHRISMEKQKV